ncbi:MAG: NADH-quinone oxidoreductase subunit I [Nitrospinae bacterium]|nr:NADH-quinone oxidoreductase subunit I [Nitrospinota bacterium]
MAITIKKIERGPKLTLWERSFVPEILRGMWITSRHFFHNMKTLTQEFALGGGRSKRSIMTLYYPEERPVTPVAYRGRPVLVRGANGLEKCVACGLCEAACPPHCISIVGAERDNGDRYPTTYTLDGAKCIFCGRCEEVCPKEAIVMSDDWAELCTYDRGEMLYDKERLLRPEASLARRLAFLRNNAFSKARYQ